MADVPQDRAVIAEIREGNHECYRQLVERYHRGLIQHLYNMTQDGVAAEDIAQEAFVRAYQKLAQYGEAYAFSTWLYKIADNIAFRQLKQTKHMQDIDELEELIPDDRPTPAETFDRALSAEAVRGAVSGLPLEYRQTITLFYWENRSYEEIAELLERPIGTIRTWLHRAKEQLRKELYGQV